MSVNELHTWTGFAQKTTRTEPSRLLQHALILLEEKPLPRSKTALDLGCGAGNEVMALLERGYNVTALDFDSGVLERLQERASEYADTLTLVQGEFHQLPRRKYGLIYASLSLPFATPENWRKTWRVIQQSVAVNGLFAAALFGPEDELLPPGKRVLITTDKVPALLPGFEIVSLNERKGEGQRVRDSSAFHTHQIILIARKTRQT